MRTNLKLAIVARGIKHQTLADEANTHLASEERVSELDITKLVTSRKDPTPSQAAALALVLGKSVRRLFPLVRP